MMFKKKKKYIYINTRYYFKILHRSSIKFFKRSDTRSIEEYNIVPFYRWKIREEFRWFLSWYGEVINTDHPSHKMKKDIKQSLLTGKGKDFRSVIAKFMDFGDISKNRYWKIKQRNVTTAVLQVFLLLFL